MKRTDSPHLRFIASAVCLAGIMGLAALLLSGAPGCGVGPEQVASFDPADPAGDDDGLAFANDPGTGTVANFDDPSGAISAKVIGTNDDDGALADVSGVSGTVGDSIPFSVTFEGGLPAHVEVGSVSVDIDALDDDLFDVTVNDLAARQAANANSAPLWATDRFNVEQWTARRKIRDTRENCALSGSLAPSYCTSDTMRALDLIDTFVTVQGLLNFSYNEHCIEKDDYHAAACFELLAFVDGFGTFINAIIASSPDLPADIRALCFDLGRTCADHYDFDPTPPDPTGGNDGNDGDDGDDTGGEPVIDVQLAIAGPDEICVDASGTYTLTATGTGADQASFTWDLLGDSATLGAATGSQTTVAGASTGFVTLVAEAHVNNALAASATLSIAVSDQGDCAPVVTFTILSADGPSTRVAGGPAGTITVTWSGNPTFPVTASKSIKPGTCAEPCLFTATTWTFTTEENPLVLEGSPWCGSDGEGDSHLPITFQHQLILEDANGVQSNVADVPFTCIADSD